ncbi:M28 family metallopeptidase [Pontiellaceae bacterium B1224]|nr:M28 family metallopeptidase [Pontiellaceae bacterium B1224]
MYFHRVTLITGLAGWIALSSYAVTLSNIVDGVSEGSYSNFHVNLFVSDGDSRGFSTNDNPRVPLPQHDLARDYIHSNFQAMGYDTWLDPFDFTYTADVVDYNYTNCNNIVAVKWGVGGTNVYILGAHYDSVDLGNLHTTAHSLTNSGPGADDNASGTAALLEAAKAIKDYIFKDTIVIVAFDAEEKGYQGSIHFKDTYLTTSAPGTNAPPFLISSIRAMVNLDTIAYKDTNTSDYVVIGSAGSPNSISFALADAVSAYTTLEPYMAGGYNLSDHKIFQAAGIDSVQLIEYDFDNYSNFPDPGKNLYYHTDGDSIDSPNYIHYDYATEITKAVVGACCNYATPIPPATLSQTVIASNTVSVSWMSAPYIEYDLLGTSDLVSSNGWEFIQHVPSTNTTMLLSVELSLEETTQRLFRVESK